MSTVQPQTVQDIIDALTVELTMAWGLDTQFARDVSVFMLYLWLYGLSPVITSGWRSPEKQRELQRRYAAGDAGVVAKPADSSQHSTTNWLGNPAATAVDLSTSNPVFAAEIAAALGIGAGLYFKQPDPVHFYKKTR
jgi:hypothetical protein